MFSAFFFIPVIGLVYNSIANQSVGSVFGSFAFLVVALLLFFIGRFKQKQYNKLGDTPLTLIPSVCVVCEEFVGSIEVKRENFIKVNQLSITSWKKGRSENSTYQKLWESIIIPEISFTESKTVLNFSFVIPAGKKPTDKSLFSDYFFWEISFEFVEDLDAIKRTWKIPVKI